MALFSRQKQCVYSRPVSVVAFAFRTELEPFLESVKVENVCKRKGNTYYFVEYKGREFLVYLTGVGPKKARKNTKALFKHFNVEKLILSGIAGGVDSSLQIGDVVVPKEWKSLYTEKTESVDRLLLEKVGQLAGVQVVKIGVTSKKFIDTKSHLPEDVSVVDMEAYEVMRLSSECSVPCVVIKGVSDIANDKGSDESFLMASLRVAETTLAFLEQV